MGGLLALGLRGMVEVEAGDCCGCSEQEMGFLPGHLQDASALVSLVASCCQQ